jgi:hypothetical protein
MIGSLVDALQGSNSLSEALGAPGQPINGKASI